MKLATVLRAAAGLLLCAGCALLAGCAGNASSGAGSATTTSPSQATSTTSSPANATIPLTSEKKAILEKINTIRAGLADGSWVYESIFAAPSTSASDPLITVFMIGDASADTLERTRTAIAGLPAVEKSVFVSKAEALETLKADFKDNPEILEGLTGNPLPDSFKVWLNDTSQSNIDQVAAGLRALPGVDEVQAPEADARGAGGVFKAFSDPESVLAMVEGMLYAPDLQAVLADGVQDPQRIYSQVAALPGVARVEYSPSGLGHVDIWVTSAAQAAPLKELVAGVSGVQEVWQTESIEEVATFTLDMFHQK